jgi:hypothetical protein
MSLPSASAAKSEWRKLIRDAHITSNDSEAIVFSFRHWGASEGARRAPSDLRPHPSEVCCAAT